MTDMPAAAHLIAAPAGRPGWRRFVLGVLPACLYAVLVLALFGGFARDHLPESPTARLGMVVIGALALLLAALLLDRREAKRDAAERAAAENSGHAD